MGFWPTFCSAYAVGEHRIWFLTFSPRNLCLLLPILTRKSAPTSTKTTRLALVATVLQLWCCCCCCCWCCELIVRRHCLTVNVIAGRFHLQQPRAEASAPLQLQELRNGKRTETESRFAPSLSLRHKRWFPKWHSKPTNKYAPHYGCCCCSPCCCCSCICCAFMCLLLCLSVCVCRSCCHL